MTSPRSTIKGQPYNSMRTNSPTVTTKKIKAAVRQIDRRTPLSLSVGLSASRTLGTECSRNMRGAGSRLNNPNQMSFFVKKLGMSKKIEAQRCQTMLGIEQIQKNIAFQPVSRIK